MRILLFSIITGILMGSCIKEESDPLNAPGHLLLSTSVSFEVVNKAAINTENFILSISNNGTGEIVFSGLVGQLAEGLELVAGTYTVDIQSAYFTIPAFDSPAYGVNRNNVVISPNQTTTVSLVCLQTNAGVRVVYSDKFLEYCQRKGYAYSTLVNAGAHTLDYGDDETRTGYFLPGNVDLVVDLNGTAYEKTISLAAQELVTVNINITNDVPELTQLVITITGVDDTTVSEDYFTFDEI